jgi:hypothetical protein
MCPGECNWRAVTTTVVNVDVDIVVDIVAGRILLPQYATIDRIKSRRTTTIPC